MNVARDDAGIVHVDGANIRGGRVASGPAAKGPAYVGRRDQVHTRAPACPFWVVSSPFFPLTPAFSKHLEENDRLRKLVESFPNVTVTVLGDLRRQ